MANPGPSGVQANMDVDANQPRDGVPTRIVVDANNPDQEVPDTKKPQVPQETDKKIKVMKFIAHTHRSLLIHFGLGEFERDLSLGDQIHNVLVTAYNVLRQYHNQTQGTLAERIRGTDYKVNHGGIEITRPRDPIHKLVAEHAAHFRIPFAKYDQRSAENWYGIAGPLLNFLSGFALRRKELRLGHHQMPLVRRGNQERVVNVTQYGIYGCHHILCEGMTFPPEKRASMAQSLGPLTTLMCYIRSERQFSAKWHTAVKRAFAHFPDIDSVIMLMRDKEPTELRQLISLMADIALIVTTRQAQRMFPPPAAFSYIFTKDSHKVGNSTYEIPVLEPTFNFSGQGSWAFYKIFQTIQWTLNLNEGTDSLAKQIVYHCMFGTFKEDLSLLSQITNQGTWSTREEMGKVFQKSNTEGAPISFRAVQQVYYSKLAQANQTGLLTSNYTQMTSQPCFSGRTKRSFSDAFFDHLDEGTISAASGRSIQHMISAYTTIKEELRELLRKKDKTLEMGTTGWRKIEDVTPTLEGQEDNSLVFNLSGRFFLGKS